MAGVQHFSGSFIQSGSSPAEFRSGISSNTMTSTGQISGRFIGDGSELTNINFGSDTVLFVGSESLHVPPTYKPWITGSGGNHTITLSTSSSNGNFNHFTFLRYIENNWQEVSDYDATQNGLASINTLTEPLGTGIHQYLLLAMSTGSKETVVKGVTVIINPNEL